MQAELGNEKIGSMARSYVADSVGTYLIAVCHFVKSVAIAMLV